MPSCKVDTIVVLAAAGLVSAWGTNPSTTRGRVTPDTDEHTHLAHSSSFAELSKDISSISNLVSVLSGLTYRRSFSRGGWVGLVLSCLPHQISPPTLYLKMLSFILPPVFLQSQFKFCLDVVSSFCLGEESEETHRYSEHSSEHRENKRITHGVSVPRPLAEI